MNLKRIASRMIITALVLMGTASVLQGINLIGTNAVVEASHLFWWVVMCCVCIIAALTRMKSWAVAGLLSIVLVVINNVEFSMFYIENHSIALIITLATMLHMVDILEPTKNASGEAGGVA